MNNYTKEELMSQIEKLKCKIEDLQEDLKDKQRELDEYKMQDCVKIYDFYTDYQNQRHRYDFNNVDYQMKHVDDIAKVFGMTMTDIEGFSDLTEEDQAIFSEGILTFINSWGLGNRVRNLPTKVWKEGSEFRFNTLGSRFLEHMDKNGNIL